MTSVPSGDVAEPTWLDHRHEHTMNASEAPLHPAVDHRAVLDALPRAVVVTDADGSILVWNTTAADLYGWREEEVLGRSVIDVLAPPADLARNRDELDGLRAGHASAGDRTVRRRSGDLIRVNTITHPVRDATGAVIAIVGSAEDVTALRVAEQQVHELSGHFQLALSAGGLGTWRWDMATGTTVWDERLEQLFGLEPGSFDGTYDTYLSLIHPDDRGAVLEQVEHAIDEHGTYRIEHRVVWPDASVHWIVGAGGVTIGADDEVTGTVGCCIDVTARMVQEIETARLSNLAVATARRERVLRERMEFLSAIHEALASSPDRVELMARVTRAAVPRLGDWCAIHVLADPDAGGTPDMAIAHADPSMVEYANQLRERFPYDPDAPRGVPQVIRTGRAEFHPEISDQVIDAFEIDDDAREIIDQLALRSAITVPLVKGARIFGAMQFVMTSSSRRYTESDLDLATFVAGRIASSLENRRLAEQQRLVADTLQQSLLPRSLPEVPGFEVAVRYWAAGEGITVGGDFYDVFALDDGTWAFVVGDVCGTGPSAAALTGLARHTIRDSAWHGDEPCAVLEALNRSILRADTNSFCTAVYGHLAVNDGDATLHVVCAGHPLPICVDAGGARAIGGPGTLLGVFAETNFSEATVTLDEGDAVVFFTDGTTDVPAPHGLTDEEFRQLVQAAAADADSAETIADGIRARLDHVLPFDRRDDDIALLVLTRRGR